MAQFITAEHYVQDGLMREGGGLPLPEDGWHVFLVDYAKSYTRDNKEKWLFEFTELTESESRGAQKIARFVEHVPMDGEDSPASQRLAHIFTASNRAQCDFPEEAVGDLFIAKTEIGMSQRGNQYCALKGTARPSDFRNDQRVDPKTKEKILRRFVTFHKAKEQGIIHTKGSNEPFQPKFN